LTEHQTPTPSAEAAEIHRLLQRSPPKWLTRRLPIWCVRLLTDAAGSAATEPSGLVRRREVVRGRTVEVIDPCTGRSGDIVYAHGGGYTSGSLRSHRRLAGHVARASGRRVLLADYRRAPKHRCPAALEDILGVMEWALTRSPGANIALCGDSAGGGLAMSAALSCPHQIRERLVAVALMSPMTDLTFSAPSWRDCAATDILLDLQTMRRHAAAYLAGTDARDPIASPLFGDLSKAPPILVQAGSDEMLRDDAVRLQAAAARAGVAAELRLFPHMQHVFQMFCGKTPEASEAITDIGRFLDRRLGG
jgi:monoterpene epsilon-lactone hydrolase